MSEKQDALVFRTFNIIVEPLGSIGFVSEVVWSLVVSLFGAPGRTARMNFTIVLLLGFIVAVSLPSMSASVTALLVKRRGVSIYYCTVLMTDYIHPLAVITLYITSPNALSHTPKDLRTRPPFKLA